MEAEKLTKKKLTRRPRVKVDTLKLINDMNIVNALYQTGMDKKRGVIEFDINPVGIYRLYYGAGRYG